jgi:hypothetical protein
MLQIRFRQLIRVVLLGLTISLPAVARADIIAASDPDSPASDSPAPDSPAPDSPAPDSPAPDSPASDSSSDTSSTDPASSDSSSSDSTNNSPTDSSNSDLASIEAVEVLIDPSAAPSLLDDLVEDLSGYKLENLDAGDMDPSPGDTSFLVSDDMGIHHCTVVPIPEPGSLALWTLAAVGIAGFRRLRSQKPSRV